jgi:hypothetical protein
MMVSLHVTLQTTTIASLDVNQERDQRSVL